MKDYMETMSFGSACTPTARLSCHEQESSASPERRDERRRSIAIAEEVVSLTQRAWRTEPLYAPAAVRDRFLASLDAGDWNASMDMAANLTGCGNPLPTSTCNELGLPTRSTYGAAAKCVLAFDARERTKRC